jgi:thiopeptide-type bacteriocin biosynthesis protein
MNVAANSEGSRSCWLSFHIFLPGLFDIFLQGYLCRFITAPPSQRLVKRLFFIRYSDEGAHLRLRLLPFKRSESYAIRKILTETVQLFARENGLFLDRCFVTEEQYDRAELYFGDTLASVYSELLNEQTSLLALRLLCACHGGAGRLAVTLAAILQCLFRMTTSCQSTMRQAIQQSSEFAAQALARANWSPEPLEDRVRTEFAAEVGRAMPQISRLASEDTSIEHLVRLLKRTRRQGALGDTVATHSLHLLCNKVGVNLARERDIYIALSGDKAC